MISAGMASYLQSLDFVINKPFKDYFRMQVNDYIENRMERNQLGNFIKSNINEVVNCVKNSWSEIDDSCIANALRAGYLDKNFSFAECSVAKHERLGPVIHHKLVEQEIHFEFESMAIYDHAPEDDEIVILDC